MHDLTGQRVDLGHGLRDLHICVRLRAAQPAGSVLESVGKIPGGGEYGLLRGRAARIRGELRQAGRKA